MNRLVCVLAIALVTLVSGCDNGPTGPMTSSASSGMGVTKPTSRAVRIHLSGTPREPFANSGLVFDIDGFVDYSMVQSNGTGSLFSLHLMAQALLVPRADEQKPVSVNFSSTQDVSVSEEGVTFQEVRYVFPERNDRLALFITFQITVENVEVADMFLDFVE